VSGTGQNGAVGIDRGRLADLRAQEERRFVDLHPRSADLAAAASAHLLGGVPMPWMTRWPGPFPIFLERDGAARCTDVAIDAYDLPWMTVQQLGCRAEYWFCPAARDGAAAAAAVDPEIDSFMHLWALNRGILLTPFHNMALFSPHHSLDDVALHTDVFWSAVEGLVA
jgi:glutamate-1-semialdehyde aminotransferase